MLKKSVESGHLLVEDDGCPPLQLLQTSLLPLFGRLVHPSTERVGPLRFTRSNWSQVLADIGNGCSCAPRATTSDGWGADVHETLVSFRIVSI
ncbi:hypothetical protein MPTK1_8g18690 [Marchantia polymorpha subsp. ruderalis]|uniref:Uncharacterized protein n=1 Tax=Marchantia polymorpha TaxID=3197 RepID=A0A2R6W857_MARPO|nr:hypothetical protein MARPO_0131s0034 [Marchantia polymorpha]BBN20387.1 hypothetical protein Mp_8g18690 [Marchantia polymorpha subsp. ruderalis]|eukprot:PTQ30040.1 hypothetical protein MARPO_0131s0034 [Marchantia polymorpha]